ncbi:amino acid permease [Streptomyces sp. NPDC058751]|uniref:amino acid permease n=1 Tax=Streptomyces sp. NPDC058751 TaxID=3346623 RepID=UPI0036D16598
MKSHRPCSHAARGKTGDLPGALVTCICLICARCAAVRAGAREGGYGRSAPSRCSRSRSRSSRWRSASSRPTTTCSRTRARWGSGCGSSRRRARCWWRWWWRSSRIVFAMARDGRFPAHRLMRRVNPRTRTPIPATVLVLVVGIVLMAALPGDALLQLITASTIIPALVYGATIVLHLAVRRRLDRNKGAFDLGRFELPVAVGALVWTVASLVMLVSPSDPDAG